MSHWLMLLAAASLPADKVEACQALCQRLTAAVGEDVRVALADAAQLTEMRMALAMAGGAVYGKIISPEGKG